MPIVLGEGVQLCLAVRSSTLSLADPYWKSYYTQWNDRDNKKVIGESAVFSGSMVVATLPCGS